MNKQANGLAPTDALSTECVVQRKGLSAVCCNSSSSSGNNNSVMGNNAVVMNVSSLSSNLATPLLSAMEGTDVNLKLNKTQPNEDPNFPYDKFKGIS